ncbi:type VI secretion system protein IglI family protein [Marinibactrum halimedae]|uniref:ImpA N-terminal domain-containing protein n=1 Tax=Marinibactrum halimedae TaxID=1444977 RepID=A0AA37T4I9_9GAMM|nr:type VI secretion system protein IglI family protein [Marinibactrum halimedae]MCD9458099.1 hypothetical protein [Marinibactrum halimedae]GLS25033.1 hypothetical protein GCM10007877_07470 [Marinibactrum halimedae]
MQNTAMTNTAMTNTAMTNTAMNNVASTNIFNISVDQDTLDDHFHYLSGCWLKGDYAEIVEKGGTAIKEDQYDVRIAIYYLYSIWIVEGSGYLLGCLEAILSLVKNYESSHDLGGFEETVEKNILDSLNLFFKKMSRRLERFSPTTADDDLESVVEVFEKIKEGCQQLGGFYEVEKRVESIIEAYQPVLEKLQKENDELEASLNTLKAEEVPNKNLGKDTDSIVEAIDRFEANNEDKVILRELNLPNKECLSYPFSMLLEKIKLMERLSERRDLYKAAIVLEDIREEISTMNPLDYFPVYFRGYSHVVAQYSTELFQHIQNHDSIHWSALKQLYSVDKDGFQKLEVTPPNLTYGSENATEYDQESLNRDNYLMG